MDVDAKIEDLPKNETEKMVEEKNDSVDSIEDDSMKEAKENNNNEIDDKNNHNAEESNSINESKKDNSTTEETLNKTSETEGKEKTEESTENNNNEKELNDQQENDNQQQQHFMPNPHVRPNTPWTEHKAPSGEFYYYNHITKQSTWKKPDNFIPFRPPFIPHYQHKHVLQKPVTKTEQKPIEKAISM